MDLDEKTLEALGYIHPDGPWLSIFSRKPGSGDKGPEVTARRTLTRRMNLAKRRAANRAHYARKMRTKTRSKSTSDTRHETVSP